MNFNLSKKQLIILSSAIGVVLLGLVGYFVFFKNEKIEKTPTPIVETNTTETSTPETSTPEKVELDYNEQYSGIFYDALQSKLLTIFNNIVEDTKKFSIYNENIEIKEKTSRQFGLNSQLSAKITTERNLDDIIALSDDSIDLNINNEEEECEEDDEECLAEKAKNEVVKINIDDGKTEGSYNGLKGDFEGTIEVQGKYLNKSSNKQLNENTSFTFLGNFAGNNEEEALTVQSFVLKTDNADIDEKNNLDDYQILNKGLIMTKDTGLVFSKLSFVNIAYNLKDLFNKMQEEQIFDFSDTPFSGNIIDDGKVEVTIESEEDVNSEEAIALEANGEEDKDDIDEEDTGTETKTEENTNIDTNIEIDDDVNDIVEEPEEEILTPSESVVETQKIYFRANKENLKTFIKENIIEITNTLKFFGIADAPSFTEDSINISAIEGSIEITGEYVKFNFNSFVIDNINFTGKLDGTELKLYTPNSIISGTLADTIDLKIENTSNKKDYNVKIKNVKNGVLMTVGIEEKSGTIKGKGQLQIKSTYTEGNDKLPALYKAPETKKPQIKFELISDTYKTLLKEVSNQYIEKEGSKMKEVQKKERNQERQKRNQQQGNQQQTNNTTNNTTNKNQPQRPTNQPQTQN